MVHGSRHESLGTLEIAMIHAVYEQMNIWSFAQPNDLSIRHFHDVDHDQPRSLSPSPTPVPSHHVLLLKSIVTQN